MEMELLDLAPDTFYHLQMRSIGSDNKAGPWGPIFQFITELDKTPPPVVTGLKVVPVGTAFVVTWTRPTGTTMVDFKEYEIEVQVAGAIARYTTTQERFEFTQEMNLGFFGTLQGAITFRVRTVDQVGNPSDWVEDTATNAPPQEVPGVTAKAVGNGIEINWSRVSDDDIKHYTVYVSTGTAPTATDLGTAVWSGNATNFTYSTLTYGTDHFISVRAVDIFNSPSATALWQGPLRPINYNEVDVTPPPLPTSVTATGTVNGISLTWATPVGSDVVGYRVRFKKGTLPDYNYLDLSGEATSAVIADLDANVVYDVGVQGYDASFNSTAWVDTTATPTVDSTVLPAPTGFGGYAKPDQISAIWNDVAGASDYEIQVATDTVFTTPKVQFPTFPFAVFLDLTPKTTYHVRVRARNRSKTPGTWHTTTVATPEFDSIRFGDQSISGGAIIENTLAGNRVLANSLRAETLQANTAIVQALTVANTLTMGTVGTTSGQIISGNYSAANGTGYRLTHNSFEMRSGLIDAKVITVGTLKSSQNVSTDGTSQPRWSLNTQGNMQVNDAVVRGSIVVGSSLSTSPAAVAIQHYNYSPGSLGWIIRGDGYAEFNNVTVRGTVYASGGEFKGSLNVASKFFVDSAGNLGIGGTAATNGPFTVNSAGTVTATSGYIAGWTIDGSSIYTRSGFSNAVGMSRGATAFWAGNTRFTVDQYGYLTASEVNISGKVGASSGTIGGWSIDNLGIYGSGRISGGTIEGTLIRNRSSGQRWELVGSEYFTGQYIKFYPGFSTDSPAYFGMLTSGTSSAQAIIQSSDFGYGRAIIRVMSSTGGQKEISLESNEVSVRSRLTFTSGTYKIWWGTSGTARAGYYNFNGPGVNFSDSSEAEGTGNVHCNVLRYRGQSVISSIKVKTVLDHNPLDAPGLKQIKALKIKKFKYTDMVGHGDKARFGLIAEETPDEFKDIPPEGELMGVNMTEINFALIKSVQELSQRIETLEAQIAKSK